MPQGSPEPLSPDVAERLIAFARACKAATRSVTLYPDGHPAITGALSRLVESAHRATVLGPITITVEPGALTIDGRAPAATTRRWANSPSCCTTTWWAN